MELKGMNPSIDSRPLIPWMIFFHAKLQNSHKQTNWDTNRDSKKVTNTVPILPPM